MWGEDNPADAEKIAISLHAKYCQQIAPKQQYTAVEVTCEKLEIADLGIALSGSTDRITKVSEGSAIRDLKTGKATVGSDGTVRDGRPRLSDGRLRTAVQTSGGFASPNNLIGYFRNTGSSNITDLSISYDAERYRRNSAAASVQFFYSLNGTSWTAVTSGDIAAASFPTGTSVYGFKPPNLVVNVSAFSITGLSIAPTDDFYLRWNINTTGSNSQGIGIDNVSLTATFAPIGTNTSVQFASTGSTVNENVGTVDLTLDITDEDATNDTEVDVVLITGALAV